MFESNKCSLGEQDTSFKTSENLTKLKLLNGYSIGNIPSTSIACYINLIKLFELNVNFLHYLFMKS